MLIVKLIYHDLKQIALFSLDQNHLLSMIFFLNLPYFNVGFKKFHQNCRVLSNVLRGSTSIFKVEERTKILEEAGTGCY